MAKTNFTYEKRQKELEKKRKKEDKLKRKQERSTDGTGDSTETGDGAEPGDTGEVIEGLPKPVEGESQNEAP